MSDHKHYPCEDGDIEFDGARAVVEEERKHIERWRGRSPQCGLALSGGGIRSASYSLGVLQGLANAGWLEHFDYLSTVSGGGYTGASLSYLLYQSARSQAPGQYPAWPRFDATRENFPYLSNPMVSAPLADDAHATGSKGWLLRRLRENAEYLTPGGGITLLSLIGVMLRNALVSLTVHVACLVLLLQAVFYCYRNTLPPSDISASWVLLVPAGLFALFGLMSLGYVLASSRFEHVPDRVSYSLRRIVDIATSKFFGFGLAALIVGALPYVDHALRQSAEHVPAWLSWAVPESAENAPPLVGTIAAIVGVIGTVLGYMQTRADTKPKIPTGPLVNCAAAALLFGVLLILFDLVAANNATPATVFGIELRGHVVLIAALALFLVLGLLPDVNYLSIHRFYRDRLMETFMPDLRLSVPGAEERTRRSDAGNETPLGLICGANAEHDPSSTSAAATGNLARGPYHIINANIVLVSSTHARYRGRGGDNFILSPLFTGCRATGWERTDPSQKNGVSLATAMAISGAAISPNAGTGGEGVTRQPVLSVLMSLFNLRMGYWLANPNPVSWESLLMLSRARSHPNLIYPGLAESFDRRNLREDRPYVLLTDGGHFENLGLYELVRRRLRLIVVCDGTADPNYTFSDLANAIEKVRADFGALIDIASEDLRAMVPTTDQTGVESRIAMSVSERGYLIAPIRYASRQAPAAAVHAMAAHERGPETGWLIYLNTTFFKGLGADLHGYRRRHPTFPDQPTADQFFDEREFEAYRELGFQTAWRLTRDLLAKAEDESAEETEAVLVQLLWELLGR